MLHCGDCLEVMRGMDAGSVDLIYADPPYCTQRDWGEFDDRWESFDVYLPIWRNGCESVIGCLLRRAACTCTLIRNESLSEGHA